MERKNIEKEEISLRSEEVQEIMGRIPSWVERWGITIVGLLLIVLLAGAAFFPCPEKMTGRFVFMPSKDKVKRFLSGYILLPAHGIGKVKQGQVVRVRLENYPDREFGALIGEVQTISNLSDKDGNFQVNIIFPNGLETDKGMCLPTYRQMIGTAEIVVREQKLIERMGIKSTLCH